MNNFYHSTRHMASCEWWSYGLTIFPILLTACHVASCAISCNPNIFHSFFQIFFFILTLLFYLLRCRLGEIIEFSGGPRHLSTISLKNFHLYKIAETVINFCFKKKKILTNNFKQMEVF